MTADLNIPASQHRLQGSWSARACEHVRGPVRGHHCRLVSLKLLYNYYFWLCDNYEHSPLPSSTAPGTVESSGSWPWPSGVGSSLHSQIEPNLKHVTIMNISPSYWPGCWTVGALGFPWAGSWPSPCPDCCWPRSCSWQSPPLPHWAQSGSVSCCPGHGWSGNPACVMISYDTTWHSMP